MTARIAALFRHPVKGFTPETLLETLLTAGSHFPCDRLFAVEVGPSGFDPDNPAHISKQKFAVLAKIPQVAQVRTAYDEQTGVLSAAAPGHVAIRARLTTRQGREAFADWLQDVLGKEAAGRLRVLQTGGGHRFMDSRRGFVSVLNLESLRDFERKIGRPVDPARLRANIHIEGWPAWSERGATGRMLGLGQARLEVLKDIDRCAATHVDPATGERDLDLVPELFSRYGHIVCGVYAAIGVGGRIAVGDEADLAPAAAPAAAELEVVS